MQGRLGTTLALWNNFAPYILPYFWKCTMAHFEKEETKILGNCGTPGIPKGSEFCCFFNKYVLPKILNCLFLKYYSSLPGPGLGLLPAFFPQRSQSFCLWRRCEWALAFSSCLSSDPPLYVLALKALLSRGALLAVLYYTTIETMLCRVLPVKNNLRNISVGIYTNDTP